MHFKLIIAFVEDEATEAVVNAAREAGATGCTVINSARGELELRTALPGCIRC